MTEPHRDQIRAFLDVQLGRLSNRALVSSAQDRLAEPDPPAWISELACLIYPTEVLDAHHILERQLFRSGVLPDSEALRSEIRLAVAQWAERVAGSGVVELLDGVTPTVVRLLHLCPGYEFSSVSIPIEEFPYASEVRTAEELARYILSHLEELVPRR